MVPEVVVVVTNAALNGLSRLGFDLIRRLIIASLLLACHVSHSAMMPEERVEYLYHSYDGGGIEITGPSVLVRKNVDAKFAIAANYYVDEISSATIDVEVLASPYTEERTQKSLTVDYLKNNTKVTQSFLVSNENDYDAKNFYFGVSQDFFGNLTTLSLGFSRGSDEVGMRNNDSFSEDADRRHFTIGLTQVLTKHLLLNVNLESITDEGFLNNPYRQYRFIDPSDPANYLTRPEKYPNSRTSHAIMVQTKYYLPYRAALKNSYRYFSDTWDIDAHTLDVEYVHPYKDRWQFIASLRYYQQSAASFYSDLFPFEDSQDFMARDKEMSELTSISFGLGASYKFKVPPSIPLKNGSVSVLFNRLEVDYDNFRDARQTELTAGTESLYSLSANVFRVLINASY